MPGHPVAVIFPRYANRRYGSCNTTSRAFHLTLDGVSDGAVERSFGLSVSYVWVVIGVAQAAFLVLAGILWFIIHDRRRRGDLQSYGDSPPSRELGWVRRTLDGAGSRFWWRRLEAARLLALIADERDTGTIRRLIGDPHAAVQSAATACLLRYADDGLAAQVLDGLASRTPAVQSYQIGVLRRTEALVTPLLLSRIRADAPPTRLIAYIDLASVLATRECMERVAALSIHQNPDVRVAVARALRDVHDDTSSIKLLSMLRDPDWRVRAQAARGLGAFADDRIIHELVRALTDPSWWVRFRAGLSLAMLGEPGRRALNEARSLPDRFGRDMATFVSGLSNDSIAELAGDA